MAKPAVRAGARRSRDPGADPATSHRVLRDVTIGPLDQGSSIGRFVFKVDPAGTELPFLRPSKSEMGTSADANVLSPFASGELEGARTLEGRTVYGGAFVAHFGHFIAEHIHRLYVRKTVPGLADCRVAYQISHRHSEPPEWFYSVLEAAGVPRDKVVLIDQPTRFRELVVAVQGHTHKGPELIEGYARLFPLAAYDDTPERGPDIYVSKSNHNHTGSYFGERIVEEVLRSAGFEVVHPEALPIRDLMRRLGRARRVVFSEGSAIHNIELCGPLDIDVFIVSRRPNTRAGWIRLLRNYVARVGFSEVVEAGVPLDWNRAVDAPNWTHSCAIVDVPDVVARMADFYDLPLTMPEPEAAQRLLQQDVARYVLHPRKDASSTSDEQLGRLLRMLRQQLAENGSFGF